MFLTDNSEGKCYTKTPSDPFIVPLGIADEYNQCNVKLQRKTMNVEETLAWYKSWVAEHPQVPFFQSIIANSL